jgi:hypothetical protein
MHVLVVSVEGERLICRQIDALPECDWLPGLIELDSQNQHMRMLLKVLPGGRNHQRHQAHCDNRNE